MTQPTRTIITDTEDDDPSWRHVGKKTKNTRANRRQSLSRMSNNQILSLVAERGVDVPSHLFTEPNLQPRQPSRNGAQSGTEQSGPSGADESDDPSYAASAPPYGRRRYSSFYSAGAEPRPNTGPPQQRPPILERSLDELIAFNEAENERLDKAWATRGADDVVPLASWPEIASSADVQGSRPASVAPEAAGGMSRMGRWRRGLG